MKTFLTIALFLSTLLLAACDDKKPAQSVPIQGWANLYGKAAVDANGNFVFGEPHYVVKAAPALRVGQTITLKFKIEGNATLRPTDSDPPARVTLFMQQRGDNLTCQGDYQHYRIWAGATNVVITAPGEFEISAKLDPSLWTDCYAAKLTPERFNQLLANAYVVGFTFGGMFFGHGVVAQNGTAAFKLISYTIN